MSAARPALGRRTIDGSVLLVLAEALIVPSGLITAGVITRRLGSDGFGLFSLAVSTISWLEWTLSSIFARATIKLVSDSEDWRPLGGAILRVMALAGLACGLLIWLLAGPIAAAMHEPRLLGLVHLLAVEVPIFCLSQAHRHILLGLGRYHERAVVTVARWGARAGLMVLLVVLGFGVAGAVAGSIASLLIELIVQRLYVQPPLWPRSAVSLGLYWQYSLPLFLSTFSLRFYDRLDLLAVKLLGGSVAQVGLYGAAQRIALVPSLFIMSLTPMLLSTFTHMLHLNDAARARRLAHYAMRGVFAMLPVAAVLGAASAELVALAFGPGFEAAVPLLNRLLLAVVAMGAISVSATVITAHSRPRLVLALTGPLMPLAILGHILLIPRLGPAGAALTTACTAGVGALVCVAVAWRTANLPVPGATLVRSLIVGGLVYVLGGLWPAPGLWVVLKCSALGALAALGYVVLGEFSAEEYGWAWAYVRRPLAALNRKAREA